MPLSVRSAARLRLPDRVLAAAVAVALTGGLVSVPLVRGQGADLPAARPGSTVEPWRLAVPRFGDQPSPLPQPPVPSPPDAASPTSGSAAGVAPAAAAAPGQDRSLEQRGREALDSLPYPWQELGYTVRFRPYTGGLLGLADPSTRTITIFVKQRESVHSLRFTIAHELGHAVDFRTGDEAQRTRYLELRGIPAGTPWFPRDGAEDYASPAGDFAEVFGLWLAGRGDFRSRMAPEPDDRQLRELAPLFAPPSARQPRSAPPPPPPPPPSPSPSPSPKRGLLDVVPAGAS